MRRLNRPAMAYGGSSGGPSSSLLCSMLCFSFSFLFFSFLPSSLFCFLFSLLPSLSLSLSLPLFVFVLSSPLFCLFFFLALLFCFSLLLLCFPPLYLQVNRGGREVGVATVLPPQTAQGVRPLHSSTTWQANGLCRHLFQSLGEEKAVRNRGEKSSSFVLCVSRGRRRHMVPFKTTPFRAFLCFFSEQWMKRRRFDQNMLFHLKEKAAKHDRVYIGPQFVICSIESSIAILIVNINSIHTCKIQTAALKVAAFFKLVLDLALVQFDPQLSNKLLIFSI